MTIELTLDFKSHFHQLFVYVWPLRRPRCFHWRHMPW